VWEEAAASTAVQQRERRALLEGVRSARRRVKQLQTQVITAESSAGYRVRGLLASLPVSIRAALPKSPANTAASCRPPPSTACMLYLPQLDDPQPGPSYLEALAAAIDQAEASIAAARSDQITSYTHLVQEQHALDAQLAEAADTIDAAEVRRRAATAAAAPNGGPAPAPVRRESGVAAAARHAGGGGGKWAAGDCGCSDTGADGSCSGVSGSPNGGRQSCCGKGGNGGAGWSSGLLPEVAEYDSFLARSGPSGGWHDDDHAAWMALLRRCKGDAARAVLMAEERLPGKARSEVWEQRDGCWANGGRVWSGCLSTMDMEGYACGI
jgi:hypothetical protein